MENWNFFEYSELPLWFYEIMNCDSKAKKKQTELGICWRECETRYCKIETPNIAYLTTRIQVSEEFSAEQRCFRDSTFFSAEAENRKNISAAM